MGFYGRKNNGERDYFSDTSVANKVNNLERRLTNKGVATPPPNKRSTWDRIASALSIGQYPVMGALRNLTDDDPNTTAWKGITEGVKSANPFGDGYDKGKASFRDTLTNLNWKDKENPNAKWYNPFGVGKDPSWSVNNVAKSVTGFAGDVILDPLNLATFGTGALVRGGTKTASKGFREGAEILAKGEGTNILRNLGLDGSDEMVNNIIKSAERVGGYAPKTGRGISYGIGNARATLVKDETLRAISDKLGISKITDNVLDKLGNNKIADGLSKKFQSTYKIQQKANAKDNPIEYFKGKATEMSTNNQIKKLKEIQKNTIINYNKMFEGISPEAQIRITDVLENPNNFKSQKYFKESDMAITKKTMLAEEHYSELLKAKENAKKMLDNYKSLKTSSDKIDELTKLSNDIDNILNTSTRSYTDIVKEASDKGVDFSSLNNVSAYKTLKPLKDAGTGDVVDYFKRSGSVDPERAGLLSRAVLDASQNPSMLDGTLKGVPKVVNDTPKAINSLDIIEKYGFKDEILKRAKEGELKNLIVLDLVAGNKELHKEVLNHSINVLGDKFDTYGKFADDLFKKLNLTYDKESGNYLENMVKKGNQYFAKPTSAKEYLERSMTNAKKSHDDLVEKIANNKVNEEEALKEFKRIDELTSNSGNNKAFDEDFLKRYPDQKFVRKTMKELEEHQLYTLKDTKVFDGLKENPHVLQRLAETIKGDFNSMGVKEKIKAEQKIEGYVSHILNGTVDKEFAKIAQKEMEELLNKEGIKTATKTGKEYSKAVNKSLMERDYKGTIKQINDKYKAVHGKVKNSTGDIDYSKISEDRYDKMFDWIVKSESVEDVYGLKYKYVNDLMTNKSNSWGHFLTRVAEIKRSLKNKELYPGNFDDAIQYLKEAIENRTVNNTIRRSDGKPLTKSSTEFMEKAKNTLKELEQFNTDASKNIKVTYSDAKLFEDEISKIAIYRAIKSNQYVFEDRFVNNIKAIAGKPINTLNDIPSGGTVFAKATDIKDVLQRSIPEDIEQFIKDNKLPKDLFTSSAPIVKMDVTAFNSLKNFDDKFEGFSMSELLAETVNKAGKMQYAQDESISLNIFDKLQQTLKINQTAVNPGFHGRNAMSNQFQNFLDIGAKVSSPKLQYQASKLLGKDDVYLNKTYITTATGKKITLKEVKDNMLLQGVGKETRFRDEMGDITNKAINSYDEATREVTKTKEFDINSIVNPLSPIFDVKHPLSSFAKRSKDMTHKQWMPYTVGRSAGEVVENQARALNFLANVMQDGDYIRAAEHTDKFLFDYGDLSDFEKNFMKRAIPFYAWMRKNVPLQVEQLFKQPSTYRSINKVQQNIEANVDKKDKISDKDKNPFAQDWFQLPFNTKKGDPMFLNPSLPSSDLNKVPMLTSEYGKTLFSSLTPFIKAPTELMMNKNVYFDSPISRGITDTKDAPGYLQDIMGGTEKYPAQISPELRHKLQSFLPSLENVGKLINAAKSGNKKEGSMNEELALQGLKQTLGTNLYSYDAKKYKKYANQDRLKVLTQIAKDEEDKKKAEREKKKNKK